MLKLQTQVLTADAQGFTFDAIPGGFDALRLVLALRSRKADYEDSFALWVNHDTATGHYAGTSILGVDDGQPMNPKAPVVLVDGDPTHDDPPLKLSGFPAVAQVPAWLYAPWANGNWPGKPGSDATGSDRIWGGEITASHTEPGCYGLYTIDFPWYTAPGMCRQVIGHGGHGGFTGLPRTDAPTLAGSRSVSLFSGVWQGQAPVQAITVLSGTDWLAAGSRGVLYGL